MGQVSGVRTTVCTWLCGIEMWEADDIADVIQICSDEQQDATPLVAIHRLCQSFEAVQDLGPTLVLLAILLDASVDEEASLLFASTTQQTVPTANEGARDIRHWACIVEDHQWQVSR